MLNNLDIQFPNELSREGSMFCTAVLLYKTWVLVSRTGSNDDDGVPEPVSGQYQTTGPAYFSPMNQGLTWHIVSSEVMENSREEIYTRMSTHGH